MREFHRSRTAMIVATLVLVSGLGLTSAVGPAGASDSLTWSTADNPTDAFIAGFPPQDGASFAQDTDAFLKSVSCVSSAFCVAIGSSGYGPTLTEIWDGTRWWVAPRSSVVGGATLNAVSCTTTTFCLVVGSFDGKPLTQTWDGRRWATYASGNTVPDGTLSGVSCVGPTDCVAVGHTAGSPQRTLVESWNGATWSIVASPNAGSSDSLSSVSCLQPGPRNFCVAVGGYLDSSSHVQPLIETWNGSTWTLTPSPHLAQDGGLGGVSCWSRTFCMAVGSTSFSSLAETWNGTRWSIVASPTGDIDYPILDFVGVSCAGINFCAAAMQANGPSAGAASARVETWNGTDWTANPGSDMYGAMSAISCASNGKFCSAVGGSSYFPIGTVALMGQK